MSPRRSPEELEAMLASLSEGMPDDLPELSSREFNLRGLLALGEAAGAQIATGWRYMVPPEGATRAKLRLLGPSVENGSAPVRVAAQALVSFQDVVASLAMSAAGKRSLFGAVPGDIRQRTELSVFPRPALGSLVFELAGPDAPDTAGEMPGVVDGQNAADRAAVQLAAVMKAASPDAPREDLAQELRQLGPRVATHLRRLAQLPLRDGVFLNLDWQQGNGEHVTAELGANEAAVLVEVIEESRATVQPQTLAGVLVTISSEEPLALRLHDGNRIPMNADQDLDVDSLTEFFNEAVMAHVEVEVTTHPVTGRDTRRYTLLSVDGALDTGDQDQDELDL